MLAGAAALAAVTLAPEAPVMAQNDENASPPITVTAPGVRHMGSTDSKSVHPDRMLVSQAVVYTHDLDLRTQAGREVLDGRVRAAAEQTCDQIDRVDPPSGLMPGGYSDCVYRAVQQAQNQVFAAVWNS
jgi:UrcA family protein